jgi:hypothetical protein
VAAAQQNEISPCWSARDAAAQLIALVEGMFVLGHAGGDRGRMQAVNDLTLQSLRSPESQGATA